MGYRIWIFAARWCEALDGVLRIRDTRKPVDGKGQREEFVRGENDVIFTRWPCRSLVDVKRKRGMMPCIDVIFCYGDSTR